MADVNKSIKSSGGDYTTVALWEAAIPADQALANPWIGSIDEAYDASGAADINVSNANAAPHRLTVGVGYRTYEAAAWPDVPAAMAQAARISSQVRVYTDAFIVEFVAFTRTAGVSVAVETNSDDVIIRYVPFDNMYTRGNNVIWHNCIAPAASRQQQIIAPASGVQYFYHCDFLSNRAGLGIQRYGGDVHISGNVFFNEGSGTGGGNAGFGASPGDYNCADDASPTGANSLGSQTATDWLEDPAVATADARIKSGKQGTLVTPGYSGTIGSLDFTQVDRDSGGSWDVGALGVVAVPAGISMFISA